MSASSARQDVLRRLRERLGRPALPSESALLRQPRPWIDPFISPRASRGGLLIEWLSHGAGAGASTLAFLTTRDEQQHGRQVLVIDPAGEFYPPAAAALGLDVEKLVIVRPPTQADVLWSWEQSLRAGGSVVIGPLEHAPVHALRRLKLAAECGGGLGLLLRPLSLRSEPSWADLRLVTTPVRSPSSLTGTFSRKVHVEPVYVRGALGGGSIVVEICDETASVSVDSELAHPAAESRTTRAS